MNLTKSTWLVASLLLAALAPPALASPESTSHRMPRRHNTHICDEASTDTLKSFSLNNTARHLANGDWEWTAFIEGPETNLKKIASVIYYLHPSFDPVQQTGDTTKPGHPLKATGWGVFMLEAEVVLENGSRRRYEHLLELKD